MDKIDVPAIDRDEVESLHLIRFGIQNVIAKVMGYCTLE